MSKIDTAKIVTANELASGHVVFLGQTGWVRSIGEATVFATAGEAETGLDHARQDAARCIIVDPFLTDIGEGEDGKPPKMTLRDTIRAFGPTIRYR